MNEDAPQVLQAQSQLLPVQQEMVASASPAAPAFQQPKVVEAASGYAASLVEIAPIAHEKAAASREATPPVTQTQPRIGSADAAAGSAAIPPQLTPRLSPFVSTLQEAVPPSAPEPMAAPP